MALTRAEWSGDSHLGRDEPAQAVASIQRTALTATPRMAAGDPHAKRGGPDGKSQRPDEIGCFPVDPGICRCWCLHLQERRRPGSRRRAWPVGWCVEHQDPELDFTPFQNGSPQSAPWKPAGGYYQPGVCDMQAIWRWLWQFEMGPHAAAVRAPQAEGEKFDLNRRAARLWLARREPAHLVGRDPVAVQPPIPDKERSRGGRRDASSDEISHIREAV
jgi:hypothetical protein